MLASTGPQSDLLTGGGVLNGYSWGEGGRKNILVGDKGVWTRGAQKQGG